MPRRIALVAYLLMACMVVLSCRRDPHHGGGGAHPDCVTVSPDAGPLAGGNLVEITSIGDCLFGANTEIRFGDNTATIVDIRSPRELIAEVPPGDRPGLVDVVLIGEDHAGHVCDCRQEDAYLYKEPFCLRVHPEAGPLAGGNLVEITSGGRCLFGPNTEIRFGDNPATIVDIRSPTELVAEVPPGDRPGIVDVVLIGEDHAGAVCDCRQNDAYLYREHFCLRIHPEAGPLAGGNRVEITSGGLCLFGPNTEILFGGKPAAIVDILSPTELVAEVPAGDRPGAVDVVLVGEDRAGALCDCVQPDAYFYKEVHCLRVEPDAGPLAGGTHVEITSGGDCLFGHNPEVFFGGKPATIVDIISPTKLVAEVPPGDVPGLVDVALIGETRDGRPCDCVQRDAYLYKEPFCLFVEPDGGPLGGGNRVEITSGGVCLFGPHTEIRFGGKPAHIVDILSPTKLIAEVPPGDAPGLVDVVLIGEDANGNVCDCVQRDAYNYREHFCVRVKPEAGPLAGGNRVEITSGGACLFGPNTEIRFGDKPANIVDILSPTRLIAEVPPGDAPGVVDVVLIGEDRNGHVCDCRQNDAYRYKESFCLRVAPEKGPLAGGNKVEITSGGACLFGPNTEIKFGGKPANIVDIISPTLLVAEVPAGDAPGPVDVVLIGEDANGNVCDCVQNDAYFYKERFCVVVEPDGGPLAGGNLVEITSGGVCHFGPNTEIKFGGKPANIIDIISPTLLVAEVPPGDAVGLVDVVLIGEDNAGGVCDCVQSDAYHYLR